MNAMNLFDVNVSIFDLMPEEVMGIANSVSEWQCENSLCNKESLLSLLGKVKEYYTTKGKIYRGIFIDKDEELHDSELCSWSKSVGEASLFAYCMPESGTEQKYKSYVFEKEDYYLDMDKITEDICDWSLDNKEHLKSIGFSAEEVHDMFWGESEVLSSFHLKDCKATNKEVLCE